MENRIGWFEYVKRRPKDFVVWMVDQMKKRQTVK